jgi:hypothetical protein
MKDKQIADIISKNQNHSILFFLMMVHTYVKLPAKIKEFQHAEIVKIVSIF